MGQAYLLAAMISAAGLLKIQPPPPPPSPDEVMVYLLALAEAPGDLRSDALVLPLLQSARDRLPAGASPEGSGPAAPDPAREALRARADAVLADLGARLRAARDDDPWLLAIDPCIDLAGQDPVACAPVAARLEALAGDNAYFHLLLAGRAWRGQQDADLMRYLQAAAAAPRYDTGMAEGFASLYRRVREAPPAPARDGVSREEAAGVFALTYVGARWPVPNTMLAPCLEATETAEPAVREACRAISGRLAQDVDSLLDLGAASALAGALGTPRQQAQLAARRREVQWWAALIHRHVWDALPGPARDDLVRAYWADVAAYGELDAMEAMVARLELPKTPPAGFDPSAPLPSSPVTP